MIVAEILQFLSYSFQATHCKKGYKEESKGPTWTSFPVPYYDVLLARCKNFSQHCLHFLPVLHCPSPSATGNTCGASTTPPHHRHLIIVMIIGQKDSDWEHPVLTSPLPVLFKAHSHSSRSKSPFIENQGFICRYSNLSLCTVSSLFQQAPVLSNPADPVFLFLLFF